MTSSRAPCHPCPLGSSSPSSRSGSASPPYWPSPCRSFPPTRAGRRDRQLPRRDDHARSARQRTQGGPFKPAAAAHPRRPRLRQVRRRADPAAPAPPSNKSPPPKRFASSARSSTPRSPSRRSPASSRRPWLRAEADDPRHHRHRRRGRQSVRLTESSRRSPSPPTTTSTSRPAGGPKRTCSTRSRNGLIAQKLQAALHQRDRRSD